MSTRTRDFMRRAGTPPPTRRISDFSPGQIAILLALLLVLTSIPVWTHPLPPLSDYINHLGRMHVIAQGNADPNLARYYSIDWQIVPNLMMDLVIPPLARVVNVFLAGQLFTVLMFTVIASGTLALHRALFGRWSVVPLLALPLLYNHIFLVGVMNYLFGIGIALWALAAWITLREKVWPLRLSVAAVMIVAMFFCHLFAVGLYGIGLLAYELWRLWLPSDQPMRRRLIDFCASGLPFLSVLPLMLASPTMRLAGENYWEPRGKIDGVMYVIQVYSDIATFALATIAAIALAWAVRHRLARMHPVGLLILAVGGIVYMAMPRTLFASYMADQRLPIALAFMLIAAADLSMPTRIVRRGFIAVLLTLLAVRVIEVDIMWSSLSTTTREFRNSMKRVTPGAKILVTYADNTTGDDPSDLGLVHAACMAMIDRSALVSTAFAVQGKQILRVRAEYRGLVDIEDGSPPSISQIIVEAERPTPDRTDYWKGWQNNYDFVYVLFTADDAPNPDPSRLTLAVDGDRFQLYRIRKDGAAPSGANAPRAGGSPSSVTPPAATQPPAPAAPQTSAPSQSN